MIEAHFDNIEKRIAERLSTAKSRVYLAVAWFTNEVLFKEIIKCCKLDVDVRIVIMDDYINRNELGLNFSLLIESGGHLLYCKEKKMHNKYCIIDNLVITGSYNWTYYAENLNHENIIECDDVTIVNGFIKDFNRIKNKCFEVTVYTPLLLSDMKQEDMFADYNYLCNDLALKGQDYYTSIIELNKDKGIDIRFEGINYSIKYDNRGIPILKKEIEPAHLTYRLNYFSIGIVPNGRPYAGRKYVHAQMTCNSIWSDDYWVDIFDSEYVKEVLSYFHESEGGTLDNSIVLSTIPEELYNPRKKYFFGFVHYIFYKYGRYGNKRKKIGTDGNVLCNPDGNAYEFGNFDTLIRFDLETKKYIEFESMTELCKIIVQSLFLPNDVDEFDSISGNLKANGSMKASIDDYRQICIEPECNNRSDALSNDIILGRFKNNPDGFWVNKLNHSILAYAYGIFSDNKYYYPCNEYEFSHSNKYGKWFILLRLRNSNVYNLDNFDSLLEAMFKDLKKQGRLGVVCYCLTYEYHFYIKMGFIRDSRIYKINGIDRYRMEYKF